MRWIALMTLDFADVRPIPAIVCLAVAGLFALQAVRYLRKARTEKQELNSSPRRLSWLRACMVASIILAAAWIVLLGLELRHPHWPLPSVELPR